MLLMLLTEDVVQAALEILKGGASTGKDGMPGELYMQLSDGFVPRMLLVMERFLETGCQALGLFQ